MLVHRFNEGLMKIITLGSVTAFIGIVLMQSGDAIINTLGIACILFGISRSIKEREREDPKNRYLP